MSNINLLSNNQYYQFAAQQQASNSNQAAQAHANDSLPQTLANIEDDGDILDLSPAARSYLSGVSAKGHSTQSYFDSANNNGQGSNFILSNKQLKTLNDILAKYKDAPFTEETFNKIQADLKQAGLSPEQLSTQEQIKSFNPTQILLDILNGKQSGSIDPNAERKSTTEAKAGNYTQRIIQHWQNISTTFSTAGNSQGDNT